MSVPTFSNPDAALDPSLVDPSVTPEVDAPAAPAPVSPASLAAQSAASPGPGNLRGLILAAEDIDTIPVEVPEWKVTVAVRTMNGRERAEMMERASDPETGAMNFVDLYPAIVIATCVDPQTGEKIFTPGDADLLNQKSGGALERVAKAGMKVSGLSEEAEKELGNDSSKENGGSTTS